MSSLLSSVIRYCEGFSERTPGSPVDETTAAEQDFGVDLTFKGTAAEIVSQKAQTASFKATLETGYVNCSRTSFPGCHKGSK